MDDDLRHIVLSPVLLVAARLDAPLDGDLLSLRAVLTDYLSRLLPCDALNEVRLLLVVPALTPVNRQRKRGVSLPALRVLHIRVTREPSDSYPVVHLRSSSGNFINTSQIVLPLRFPNKGCTGRSFRTSAVLI